MSGSWAEGASRLVGVHRPGDSWLHRLPAGPKVAGLVVLVVALLHVHSPYAAGAALAGALAVLASARVPWRWLAVPARAVVVVLLLVGALQVWLLGWPAAVTGVCRVGATLALAWSVSLTTPVTEMLDLLRRVLAPLRLAGADPERVALTLALAIRSIPMVIAAAEQADQARLARGRRRSVTALVVPTVVRSMRIADALGDALIARGHGAEPAQRHTDGGHGDG